jgi:hypothetical protein
MAKVKIEVEVEIDGKPNATKPEDFTFVGVKVLGGEFQQCPLPKDAPCPRRFVADLVAAAAAAKSPKKAEPEGTK